MFKLVLKYVKGSARIFAVIAPIMMLLPDHPEISAFIDYNCPWDYN